MKEAAAAATDDRSVGEEKNQQQSQSHSIPAQLHITPQKCGSIA